MSRATNTSQRTRAGDGAVRKEGSGVTSAHWVRVGSEVAPSAAHRVRCLRQEQSAIRDDLFFDEHWNGKMAKAAAKCYRQTWHTSLLESFRWMQRSQRQRYDTNLCFQRTKKTRTKTPLPTASTTTTSNFSATAIIVVTCDYRIPTFTTSLRSLSAQASFPPCQPCGPINRQTRSTLHPSRRLRHTQRRG